MIDRISFVFGEAIQNLRRHGFMTFSAVATVAISLYLVGGLGYTYLRAMDYARSIPGRFEMYILLREGTPSTAIQQTASAIRAIPSVKTVSWIPRDKAWALKQKEQPELTEGLDNPLPDAFKVTLSDLSRGDEVADQIRALPAVEPQEGVQYLADEQRVVQGILRFLQWLGSLGALLFIIAGILIYNTIRLAAISRRVEVRIMRLVGASRATVLIPFLLEGAMEGAVGGLLSALFVRGSYVILTREFGQTYATQGIGTTVAQAGADFPLLQAFWILPGLGIVYGLACSLLALRLNPEVR